VRILLIHPNFQVNFMSPTPAQLQEMAVIMEKGGTYPPLGLGYVAATAEKEGHDVKILDCTALNLSEEETKKELQKIKPEIIGVQFPSVVGYPQSYRTVELARAVLPDIPIVVGGAPLSLYAQETLEKSSADMAVRGEGEYAFIELSEALERKRDLRNIRGLSFKENGRIIHNPDRPLIEDLDGIPFPARHLLPNEKYYLLICKETTKFTTLITTRGCPFGCIFCDRPHYGKTVRFRSPINVVDEIEECVGKYGIKEIMIEDETFTIKKSRVREICSEIKKRKLDFRWQIRTRVDSVDKELLQEMADAGCYMVALGVESGDERILNSLKKDITLEQAVNAFRWSKEAGLVTLAYFMIGNPGETKESIQKTVSFAKKIDPDYFHIQVLIPRPTTQLYEMMRQKGFVSGDYWRDYVLGKFEEPIPIWETSELTKEYFDKAIKQAYWSLCFRPKYIIRMLRQMRSFSEFTHHMEAAWAVLKMKWLE